MNMVNLGDISRKTAMAAWAVVVAAYVLGAVVARLLRTAADGQSWPFAGQPRLGRLWPPVPALCRIRSTDRRLSMPSRASPSSDPGGLPRFSGRWD